MLPPPVAEGEHGDQRDDAQRLHDRAAVLLPHLAGAVQPLGDLVVLQTMTFDCLHIVCWRRFPSGTAARDGKMVRVPGLEPGTYRLGGDRSIHLSYTRSAEQYSV